MPDETVRMSGSRSSIPVPSGWTWISFRSGLAGQERHDTIIRRLEMSERDSVMDLREMWLRMAREKNMVGERSEKEGEGGFGKELEEKQ